jgi:hypothetical protein
MDDRQRQLAFLRFMEIETELEALAEGRVVDGDPATVEAELLEEQDELSSLSGRTTWSVGTSASKTLPCGQF